MMVQYAKAASLLRCRSSHGSSDTSIFNFLHHHNARTRSSLSQYASAFTTITSTATLGSDDTLDNQVLVEGKAWSRTAILNRPSALNALNTSMVARLDKLYRSWEEDPNVGFVVLKGSGRAFCAGGDVVSVYRLINEGKIEACKEFFKTIYTFIYFVGTYLKPHVALLNGITMGGGAGVSIPGIFRVATEKTIFSTPETLIGFHPDAGASFYLSRLSGHLGEYLALTGERLNGAEMVACGLATHYSRLERLPIVEEQLGKLVTDDPSVIETALENGKLAYPEDQNILHRLELVNKCFSHETVEDIVQSLEIEASQTKDAWCITALNRLKEASPLSLKVTLRSIREGRFQTLDECLSREYTMTLQAITKQISGDFCEGIRARVVDKDLAPKWNPPNLEQVSNIMVDEYFSPINEFEPRLELPTKLREAFT